MKALKWRNTLLLIAATTLFLVLAVVSRGSGGSPVLVLLAGVSLTVALLFGKRGV
jgi:hypothetical protein